ncbi:signal transduction protein [Actinoplanes ianthinogenes]|uniref:Signal transduction protein n=1 Tax=Actinoplanes ianthinogenes TaxID=122358 RepID=A0ABN6CNV4_9ACTN|nr:CBS domain-containing protein [Actinoplanes ianthinogenes]BCJ46309.1 signal transduction protein [Actinoplanes ianthinogenes]GGR33409.1 signal transduction protein [Actinoplanes ianthinogenes]
MRISDILRVKGNSVVTVAPDMSVRGLVDALAKHRIGAVVVSRDGRAVEGIVSERDVVRALAAQGAAVLTEPVSTIQTTQVRTVSPEARLEDVERLMTEHRFRHVPVVVNGHLAGVVSIGDVVKNRIDELETERSTLADYITGDRT